MYLSALSRRNIHIRQHWCLAQHANLLGTSRQLCYSEIRKPLLIHFTGTNMHASKLASIQIVAWKILEKHHIDPVSVFKKVRLNPALMHQPGARHPLDKVADLWKEMANRIKDPCFGLTSAECWHPSNFGTLGYAMLVSTSLRMALERLIRFHRVIEDIDFGEIHEDKSAGILTFTISNSKGTSFSPAREDAALAWLISILRMNYQDELATVSVNVTHPAPLCSEKYINF